LWRFLNANRCSLGAKTPDPPEARLSVPSAPPAAAAPLAVALAVAGAVAAGLAFVPAVLNDGDTFLHIRAGEAILDTHSLLPLDPFSATRAGAPWQTHEWLAELALGAAHRYAGLAGVLLLTALAGGIAVFQMTRAIGRYVEPAYAVLAVAMGVMLAAPGLLARPHVLVLPLLTTVLVEAFAAAEERRTPRLWLIVPALWLWANAHGSFVVGLGLLGLAGLEALIAAWRDGGTRAALPVALRWGLVGLAGLAATVAGPHGLATLTFPLTHAGNPALQHIGEWMPLDLSKPHAFHVAVAALILILSRGVTAPATRIVAVLVLMAMAAAHVRHLMLLGIIAPVLLAPTFGQLRPATAAARPQRGVVALLVVALLAVAAGRFAVPPTIRDSETTPVAAVRAVPADIRQRPVFNDYAFGAYLIYAGIPPSIDSRVELYGAGFIAEYGRVVTDRCRLAAALEHADAGWTILAPRNPAATFMERMPGWPRLYADEFAVVHRRDGPMAMPPGC
jgi:hypothetical protein